MGNKYNPKRENCENALRIYKETRKVLGRYLKGEEDEINIQNAQMVLDGLENIIKLKENGLNTLGEDE